jgi:hypothetical protein
LSKKKWTPRGIEQSLQDEPIAIPPNVQPLVNVRTAPVPEPELNSSARLKVQWKLKNPERKQKQRLFLLLFGLEIAFQHAFLAYSEGSAKWTEVEWLGREYLRAIDQANCFIAAVWNDQEQYCWLRSAAWKTSKRGCAYQEWMKEWSSEIRRYILPDPATGENLVLEASKRFLDLRVEPIF